MMSTTELPHPDGDFSSSSEDEPGKTSYAPPASKSYDHIVDAGLNS